MLVIVPLICLGLFLVFRYTKIGKGIRASVSNPTAARLAGLPIGRLSLITWAIAGVLAAVSAILAAPNYAVFDPAQMGPALMLPALGAAAFGAFQSFQVTFAAAIGLGVLQSAVTQATGNGTWGAPALSVADSTRRLGGLPEVPLVPVRLELVALRHPPDSYPIPWSAPIPPLHSGRPTRQWRNW